jgi:hypothetical protein
LVKVKLRSRLRNGHNVRDSVHLKGAQEQDRGAVAAEQRAEFWRRFHADIDRFREEGADCDITINSFEVRRWDVKFTKQRAAGPPASVTLALFEHVPSRDQFLLAVTPTYTVEGVVTQAAPFLVPVFFDPVPDTFWLQPDHGPVEESRMTEFFVGTVGALLARL